MDVPWWMIWQVTWFNNQVLYTHLFAFWIFLLLFAELVSLICPQSFDATSHNQYIVYIYIYIYTFVSPTNPPGVCPFPQPFGNKSSPSVESLAGIVSPPLGSRLSSVWMRDFIVSNCTICQKNKQRLLTDNRNQCDGYHIYPCVLKLQFG